MWYMACLMYEKCPVSVSNLMQLSVYFNASYLVWWGGTVTFDGSRYSLNNKFVHFNCHWVSSLHSFKISFIFLCIIHYFTISMSPHENSCNSMSVLMRVPTHIHVSSNEELLCSHSLCFKNAPEWSMPFSFMYNERKLQSGVEISIDLVYLC